MSLKLPRSWDFSSFKTETSRIARSKSVVPADGGLGPPRSSSSMDRPLKTGWLKRLQRSLVRTWQQRYFVLRGDTLTYHKDHRETTVQGVISLRFSKVNELPPSSDDPGKFLFEIIPRSTGDRERCPYVLMANSQQDMEDWVRTLRRVIGVPTTGVFGRSLLDTVTSERGLGALPVPVLVQKCVEFIREQGLEEEGIFRLPGQDNAVRTFRDAFDAGQRPSFPRDTDVHTVASLLKLYLRELPEPVVPWTQYQDFLDCTALWDPSREESWEKLEDQISVLPRVNYSLLSYICRFLFEVQQHSQLNKMTVENLATVMGINLLKPQIQDPVSVMKATPQIQKLMTVMIRQHETLFPLSKDLLASPPPTQADRHKNSPRNLVGWESSEMCDASLSESPEEDEDSDGPGPDLGPCSHPSHLQDAASLSGSPRKRTQTLPVFHCPLLGNAAKVDAVNRWSRVSETPEDKTGTFSEDIFKILDLRSAGSLFGGSPSLSRKREAEETLMTRRGSDDTNRSSTPKTADLRTVHNQNQSQNRSPHKSLDCLAIRDTGQQANSQKANSQQANSQQANSQKANSQQANSQQANSQQLNGQQVKGQEFNIHQANGQQANSHQEEKNEDQRGVASLQEENAALRTALEAERRRVAELEIRLKDAERSRDEAQRQNQQLQRDVQRLLSTGGQRDVFSTGGQRDVFSIGGQRQ